MAATPEHPQRRSPRSNGNGKPRSNGNYTGGYRAQHNQPRRIHRVMDDLEALTDDTDANEPILLPQDLAAERALLGSVMIDPNVMQTCAFVKPQYFFREQHRLMWQTLQEMRAANIDIDPITLTDALRNTGRLEHAGGELTVYGLGTDVPTAVHAESYARIIAKKYASRFMIKASGEMAGVGYRGDEAEMASAWALAHLEVQEVFGAIGVTVDGSPTGPRHQLLTLAQMRDRPRPEWIIPGFLHERKRNLIFGDSNTGKSFLAADIGLCIATGRAWHGHAVQKPGAVVYVCAEGADDIMNRVDVWLQHHGIDDAPNFWIVEDSPNLLEHGDVAGVIERIKNTLDDAPTLVIFDTLAASMTGGNENDALDMGIVIGAVHRVQRECNCGVLVVHHSGKDDSKGPRGNSSLRADVDLAIKVSMDSETGIIAVNGDKWRSGDKKRISYGFRLVNKALDHYADLTSCILEATGNAPASTASSPQHTYASHAPASGRMSAPDRLFALMQEMGKPLRDAEWKRLFVERGLGKEKTYEAAILSLRERHTIVNVNGAWVAEGIL